MKSMGQNLAVAFLATSLATYAAEHRLQSPDGKITVAISEDGGLHYSVEVDADTVVPLTLLPGGG